MQGLGAWLRAEQGQSSVEFALVAIAMLSVMAGIAALWRFGETGGLLRLASEAASHATGSGGLAAAVHDVSRF